MQKLLSFALSCAALGATAGAQIVIDPCGPGVFGTPVTNPDLGNLNLGVTEVGQVWVIPNPSGPGYLGHATVEKIGQTNYDAMSFTWAGPGNVPVVTTDCDSLNGSGDEFQCSLSIDGLLTVLDCGAGNPNTGGANRPLLASRSIPSGSFTVVGPLTTGFPSAAGYYDPQLGRFDIDRDGIVDDVVYWAAAAGGIDVGKLNRTTGAVTNVITAIPPQTQVTGFQFCHSPSPVYDSLGMTRALIFSVYALNTGSDGWFFPGEAKAHYIPANNAAFAFYDDGVNWDANPAILKGTAMYARAAGGYGDPLVIEHASLGHSSVPAATGGTATHFGFLPLSVSGATVISAVNFGFTQLPTPIPPGFFNLAGWGNVCVVPDLSLGVGVVGSEFGLSFPVPGGLSPGAIFAQAVHLNITSTEVYLSNVALLVLR